MKNKLKAWWARVRQNRVVKIILGLFKRLWGVLSHNLGLKLLSLVMAILLWNYVISTDTSITRTKTVTGLTGYISGTTTLSSNYSLALLDDPSEALSDISVLIEVSQSEYAYVSADNIQVTLDLSSVRTAGVNEVSLRATTSYGRVVSIVPDSLSLTFESIDSRSIPVNVQLTGDDSGDYWYNVSKNNPSVLTISGASSLVQSIASAYVYVDVTDATESFTVAEQYVLVDSDGNEIDMTMLERSSSSVSVTVDVYPTKEIPISQDLDEVITGQPADGYVVTGVSIQPETLTVAAEQELLDSISELLIEPISVDGLSQSFTVRATVSTLSSFKSVSADEVYVTVTIAEETIGVWVEDVPISYINKRDGLILTAETDTVDVYVTGPRSVVEELEEEGFVATVDLTDLESGDYTLTLSFPTVTDTDVTFTPEFSEVTVSLMEDEALTTG